MAQRKGKSADATDEIVDVVEVKGSNVAAAKNF